MRQYGAWKCVVRASVHKRVEEGRGGRRWMPFRQSLLCADGPLMAPQLATKSPALSACFQAPLVQTRSPLRQERRPTLPNANQLFRVSLIPHSENYIKLQNIGTLTPAQTRALPPNRRRRCLRPVDTPNVRSRRPRSLQKCTKEAR